MPHRPWHSPRRNTPGSSGPPGRNYSKPTPSKPSRPSAPPGERGGGGYTAPSKPTPSKPSTPKPGTGSSGPPGRDYSKPTPPKKVISEDTGREAGIKKYATTGLKELGKHRQKQVISLMERDDLSVGEKQNIIKSKNLTGALNRFKSGMQKTSGKTYTDTSLLRKQPYITTTGDMSLLNPNRHRSFNKEMSNVIRTNAQRFGLDRYDPFVNDIYSQLGAKQFALQYNAALGSEREVTGIGNVLGLFAAPIYQFGSELAKASPSEYAAKAASDTLLNWKGIFSTSSEETKAYKADPYEFEQQLVEDAIMKIRDEANRRKNVYGTGLMGG